jgi:DNA-binding transcriptional regulator YhcF (GntR family)
VVGAGLSAPIRVDHGDPTPPFEQVRAAVAAQVAAGELRPGDRLPTVRALAGDLGLAVNTVAKAYRELELAGVIETRGRAGSFVTGNRRDAAARAAAAAYVAEARALGLSDAEVLELVRRLL